MNINVQQLLVALVMLVPGFIATGVQRAFLPKRFSSDLQWVVHSLLLAAFLNGLVLSAFLINDSSYLSLSVEDLTVKLKQVKVETVAFYLLALYSGGAIWGALSGAIPKLGLRAMLNQFGIVSYSEDPSVWHRLFVKQRPTSRPKTWVQLGLDDGRTILGHLCHGSEHIDKDQPFEIYLDEVHVRSGPIWEPIAGDGMYLRLNPDQPAELHFKPVGWMPNK